MQIWGSAMLFTYKYVVHPFAEIQEALDELFCQVWCRADSSGFDYHLSKSLKVIELFECMKHGRAKKDGSKRYTKKGEAFIERVKHIYNDFLTLEENDREKINKRYLESQDIEKCVIGVNTPLSKDELFQNFSHIAKNLEEFYDSLWGNSLFENQNMSLRYSTNMDHYKEFSKLNESSCPFCGMTNLYTWEDKRRESYDHFLPKSKYYLSTMNLKNLVPMCNKCNEDFKKAKDPLNTSTDSTRRHIAFYPYAQEHPYISMNVSISLKSPIDICSKDITISFDTPQYKEQLDTWDDIFCIKERYKTYCAMQFRNLLEQTLKMSNYDIRLFMSKLNSIKEAWSYMPYYEGNFLKILCAEAYQSNCIVTAK